MSHEIFIHIGLHKTGTTSLQSFFALNEAVLGDHGIYFPRATREAKAGQIIHSNLSWELRKHGMFNPQLGCFADLVREIENSPFTTPCKWIISGEGLSRLPKPKLLLRAFKRWPVTVIAYVRDPVEAAPSLYTEQLKGGSRLSFDEWIAEEAARWLNPKTVLKPWREGAKARRVPSFFERLTARRPLQQFKFVERRMQTELLHKGSLIDDFMQLVDPQGKLPPLRMPEKERLNARISALSCLTLLLVNSMQKEWPADSDSQALDQRNLARRAASKLFPDRQRPFEATPAQRARLKELFRIDDSTATQHPPGPVVNVEPIPPLVAKWFQSLIPDSATEIQRQQVMQQPLRFAREQAVAHPFATTTGRQADETARRVASIYRELPSASYQILREIKDVVRGRNNAQSQLCPSLAAAAIAYGEKRYAQARDMLDVEAPKWNGYLGEFLRYLWIEASFLSTRLQPERIDIFRHDVESGAIPPFLAPYYRGILAHVDGDFAACYTHFETARYTCAIFINSWGDAVEPSIRGLNSAISFQTLEYLFKLFPEPPTALFGFKLPSQAVKRHNNAHVLGCDEVYFAKFFQGFYQSFQVCGAGLADLWVNISNPSDQTLEAISAEKWPGVNFSFDWPSHPAIKTYLTTTRFILASHLAASHNYHRMVTSDIDIRLTSGYADYLALPHDVVIKRSRHNTYPWRRTGAALVSMKTADPQVTDRFLGGLLRHLAYVYQPSLSATANNQWWIDQFALAILADANDCGLPGFAGLDIAYISDDDLPLITPKHVSLSKDDFATWNLDPGVGA